MAAGMVLQLVLIALLSGVGGLVIWLHIRLHRIQAANRELTTLSETLTGSLESARTGMAELARAACDSGPELQARVEAAAQIRQELTWLLDRAEKLAEKLDMATSQNTSASQSFRPPASAPRPSASPEQLTPKAAEAARPAELVMREEDMVPDGATLTRTTAPAAAYGQASLFGVPGSRDEAPDSADPAGQPPRHRTSATVSEAEEDLRRALAGRL